MNDPTLTLKVRITRADRKRLEPHLAGWNSVSNMLQADLLDEEDLRKLVLIEAGWRKREPIIERLVGAYLSKLRRRTIKELSAYEDT